MSVRIGRVRMKNGGADVRILDRKIDAETGENWRGRIITAARRIADFSTPDCDLVGYVIIGLYEDGTHSFGWKMDHERSPVPRRLMPSYVAELVREDMITNESKRDR